MFTNMNSDLDAVLLKLGGLGLSRDEATAYVELLRGPSNHARLSLATGINRTKVYRIAESLEKMGLVTKRADDRGTFLAANDISSLEDRLIDQEAKIKKQRAMMADLYSDLSMFTAYNPGEFFINTYEGPSGFKQMIWNELRASNETLSFGNGTIEQQSQDREWSRRHRDRQNEAGYKTREITNYRYGTKETDYFTSEAIVETGLYSHRMIPEDIIRFDGQTVIYNHTVAIYHWKHHRKVGLEIISEGYANMMRQVFETYWKLAGEFEESLKN